LIKSEPSTYSFARLQKEKSTRWDGVRNPTARNNLRAMKVGDLCFFYHTGDEKQIVGIARVSKEAYADPTAKDEDWSAVDVEPVEPVKRPVTLAEVKSTPSLKKMQLVVQSRLSVQRVTPEEWATISKMTKG
jgi:predicted RNA-binding protein with PUA-like domain